MITELLLGHPSTVVDLLRGPGSAAHADSCTGNHLPASLQLYQGMGCTHPLRLHQNELVERDALHARFFSGVDGPQSEHGPNPPQLWGPPAPCLASVPCGTPTCCRSPMSAGLPAPPAAAVTVSCPRWSGQLLCHLRHSGFSSVAG